MRRFPLLVVAVLSAFAAVSARAQTPLDTAFTYQGELASSGTPATGPYDIRFRLYDNAANGSQIGSTLCSDNLAVTGGRFSVSLDFGAAFAGQKRFLEIEVRQDTGLDCSDATGFTLLTPRQELTATPNATFAQNAATATTATNATSLNGQSPSFYQNAANLSGTLADAQLSSNVARLNGNQTFTGLLNFTNAGNTFAGSGAGLTNLSAASINAGTLANARTTGTSLSTPSTLVLRDASGNFSASTITAALNGNAATSTVAATATNATQLNGQAASFYTNASNLTTGTVAEAQLSSNIPRLNANRNHFTGFDQVFEGLIRVRGGIITDDYQAGWNTTDLGLYSARPGYFMRFVTSGGGFVWYSDGVVFPGGNAARMQLTSGGNLSVIGSLSKGGGSFKIDHPLDPENKYLYHSFVESPDMMNVYNGNITTDSRGFATVELPDYFEALNRDYRYQLTVVDDSENDFILTKVYREIGVDARRQFTINSSQPNIKVSWQVTGIRKDAWAENNRIPNSVDKVGNERGKYLHPEAFDKPASRSIPSLTAPVSQSESK